MAYRYTVNQITKDVDRKLHTGGTSMTQDFFGALDEGRRNMTSRIQPFELERTMIIEQALYDQVGRYAVPDDLNEDNVVDIKALSSRRNLDTLDHPLEYVYRRRFDQKRNRSKNIFSVIYDSGVKYLEIYHPRGMKECQQTVITDADSLSNNGTWNTGGNLTNLQVDKLNFISQKGSLKFDLNDSGTIGFIENFSLKSTTLYDFLETGAVFTWVNLPVYSIVTSIKITLGSSLTDTYSFTVSNPHNNNEFIAGWNLLKYPIDTMNSTGTPNPRAITYVRFDFTTTGQAMANCNIDNVVARKGIVYQVTYASSYCFVDPVTLIWKQFATQNTDFIPLEEQAYQLLMLETALVILEEAYGSSNRGNDNIASIKGDIERAYLKFIKDHKQDSIDPFQTGYIFGNMYDGYTDDSLSDNNQDGGIYNGS